MAQKPRTRRQGKVEDGRNRRRRAGEMKGYYADRRAGGQAGKI